MPSAKYGGISHPEIEIRLDLSRCFATGTVKMRPPRLTKKISQLVRPPNANCALSKDELTLLK